MPTGVPIEASPQPRQPNRPGVEYGSTYVDVHTKKNPNGEIRGQVKVTG